MKRIIDKKKYNTEKAEKLHGWTNGYRGTDFSYCKESLYRSTKGALFLAGEGGARTAYARRGDRGLLYSGEGIRPITRAEAIAWLEEHEGSEVIMKHFPDGFEEA